MRPKKIIIVAILIPLLFMQMGGVMAQGSPAKAEVPQVIKDCEEKKPKYPPWNEISLAIPYPGQYGLNFRIAFEKARTGYHAYMECVFENTVKIMLDSAGGDTSGIFDANTPNLPNLPDWLIPEKACPSNEKGLVEKLKGASPDVLINPLQSAYNDYVDHLNLLFRMLSNSPPSNAEPAMAMVEKYNIFFSLVESEIQDALNAMEGAFIGLKEMRQAYMMHVHFQCMLKNLEVYRRAMENLRKVISALPDVIVNESIHK